MSRAPRQQRSVTRREALIAAAAWAMAEYGPGDCSARTIAAAADLPLAAVSYYFSQLDELLGLAAKRLVASWLEHASAATTRIGAGRDAVVEALTQALLPSTDPVTIRSRYEVVIAAARSETLAGPVTDLHAGLADTIAAVLANAQLNDPPTPAIVRAVVDGVVLDALARGDHELSAAVHAALAALLT